MTQRDLELQGQTDPQLISSLAAAEKAKLNLWVGMRLSEQKLIQKENWEKLKLLMGELSYDDSDAPYSRNLFPPKPLLEGDDIAADAQDPLLDPLAANPAGQAVDFGNEIAAVTGGATQVSDLANVSIENTERQ